jgi:hypothetical protein
MSYLPAIESLEAAIAEARKDLSEKEFVLAKLKGWQSGKGPLNTGLIDSQKPLELPPPATSGSSLIGELRKVIRQLGDQEFQVVQLEQLLKSNGYIVGGKYPRARISSELATLVHDRDIERTFTGAGSTPHRYRAKREVEKG